MIIHIAKFGLMDTMLYKGCVMSHLGNWPKLYLSSHWENHKGESFGISIQISIQHAVFTSELTKMFSPITAKCLICHAYNLEMCQDLHRFFSCEEKQQKSFEAIGSPTQREIHKDSASSQAYGLDPLCNNNVRTSQDDLKLFSLKLLAKS